MRGRGDAVGTITYANDGEGDQLSAATANASITRTFDNLGRVLTCTDAAGATVSYSYDNEGNLTSITYPGNKTVTYTYDGANRMKTVTDWAGRVTTYTYDTAGRLIQTDRPNGTRQRLQYDAAHRLTAAFEERGAVSIWQAAYTYDDAHRLTNAAITPMPRPFAPAPAVMTYDLDNRLATYNGQAVSSDLDGNMLAAPLHGTLLGNLTWDARNRLVAAGNTTYAYDAQDRRTARTIAGNTTIYTWSRGAMLDRLLVTANPDGSVTRYVHGLGLLYEEHEPAGGGNATTTQFYHFNWQGSTIALSDATGNVTARMAYSAYGEVTIEGGSGFQLPSSLPTPFLFNGQFGVLTEPHGLYAMQARFYSPVFRRFLSEDPAGFAGGINLYAYANGDPVNLMDPFGLGPVRNSFVSGLAGAFGNFARDAYYGVGDVAIGSIGLPLALASYVGGYGLGAVGVPNHLIGQGDAIMANLSPYANAGYYDPNSPTSLTLMAGSLLLPVKMLPQSTSPIQSSTTWVVGSYRELQALSAGQRGAIQAHHILEQRHLVNWGLDPRVAPAVLLPREEHLAISAMLRRELPYGQIYSRESVWSAYERIYADTPEWLETIGSYFKRL